MGVRGEQFGSCCPVCGDSYNCDCSSARVERAERRAARRAPNPWDGPSHRVATREDRERWARQDREKEENERRVADNRRREEVAKRDEAASLKAILKQDFRVEVGDGVKWLESSILGVSVTEKWRSLRGSNRPVSRITVRSGRYRETYCNNYPPVVRVVGEDGQKAWIDWAKFHELQDEALVRRKADA